VRAKRTDRNHADIRDALRADGCTVDDLSAVGNGIPDLFVHNPATDVLAYLEVKDGNNVLTPEQQAWWARWARLLIAKGVRVEIVRSIEEAREVMK
jgi:hypothetical protein